MSRDIADLDPKLQMLCKKWLDSCHAQGINVFLTQTYRSDEEQDADFAKGRTAPGSIITNAKAGESPHNTTLEDGTPSSQAFDFAIQTSGGVLDWNAQDPAWKAAISIGEGLGLRSGSTFHSIKDNPHFELSEWQNS